MAEKLNVLARSDSTLQAINEYADLASSYTDKIGDAADFAADSIKFLKRLTKGQDRLTSRLTYIEERMKLLTKPRAIAQIAFATLGLCFAEVGPKDPMELVKIIGGIQRQSIKDSQSDLERARLRFVVDKGEISSEKVRILREGRALILRDISTYTDEVIQEFQATEPGVSDSVWESRRAHLPDRALTIAFANIVHPQSALLRTAQVNDSVRKTLADAVPELGNDLNPDARLFGAAHETERSNRAQAFERNPKEEEQNYRVFEALISRIQESSTYQDMLEKLDDANNPFVRVERFLNQNTPPEEVAIIADSFNNDANVDEILSQFPPGAFAQSLSLPKAA